MQTLLQSSTLLKTLEATHIPANHLGFAQEGKDEKTTHSNFSEDDKPFIIKLQCELWNGRNSKKTKHIYQ